MERINLLKKHSEIKIEEIKSKAQKFITSTISNELNAKQGDIVEFVNGFGIEMSSEIIGFDDNNNTYIVWDCYWFPLEKGRISKILTIN